MNEKVKVSKEEKSKKILLGCVDQFIKTGKPVGSNTLKEAGFEEISSATIRNYFAELEEEGYLLQQHTSGGRIPTVKAYRLYIEATEKEILKEPLYPSIEMQKVLNRDTIDLGSYLLEAVSWLSSELKAPVFLSSPRFDNDLVKAIKPVIIDQKKCLFVMVTRLGQILTEILPIDESLSHHVEKRLENYFSWRLRGTPEDDKPQPFEEQSLAEHFYNELMLRYIVKYTHFANEEIVRSGFANLLFAEDLKDTSALANTLGLYETPKAMRLLLKEAMKRSQLSYWVGEELHSYHPGIEGAALVALPYKIGHKAVGSVAILNQSRSPFSHWIETLYPFVELLSKNLTLNLYQHGISYREAKEGPSYLPDHERVWLIQHRPPILLENRLKET